MGRTRRRPYDAGPLASWPPELIDALRAVSPDVTEPPADDHRLVINRIRWFRLIHEHGACGPACERCPLERRKAAEDAQRAADELRFKQTHNRYAEPRPFAEDPRTHGWTTHPKPPTTEGQPR